MRFFGSTLYAKITYRQGSMHRFVQEPLSTTAGTRVHVAELEMNGIHIFFI